MRHPAWSGFPNFRDLRLHARAVFGVSCARQAKADGVGGFELLRNLTEQPPQRAVVQQSHIAGSEDGTLDLAPSRIGQ
jgi:hypothetical protein